VSWISVEERLPSFNPRPRTAGDLESKHAYKARPSCFNPRPRTAGDLRKHMDGTTGGYVSTHARAQRATQMLFSISGISTRFNPRPRTAGDCTQSPEASRRIRFNPRPRTAGDSDLLQQIQQMTMFQPTPAHSGRPRLRIRSH